MHANVFGGRLLIEIHCLAVRSPKNPGLLDERLAFAITDAFQPQSGGPGTVSRLFFTLRLVYADDLPHPAISLRESKTGWFIWAE